MTDAVHSASLPPRRWRDDLRLLNERDLRLLVASRLVSDVGNGIAPIALAFGVLGLPGGDARSLGLVLFCAALPRLLFLLLGGVIADRVRSRARLMAAAEEYSRTIRGSCHSGSASSFLNWDSSRRQAGLRAHNCRRRSP